MTFQNFGSTIRDVKATRTDRQRLIEVILGCSVEEFVRSRRATGRAWRLIERDLFAATGEDVTYETLRSWFPDEPDEVEERKAS